VRASNRAVDRSAHVDGRAAVRTATQAARVDLVAQTKVSLKVVRDGDPRDLQRIGQERDARRRVRPRACAGFDVLDCFGGQARQVGDLLDGEPARDTATCEVPPERAER
jgi:hypothetical protein